MDWGLLYVFVGIPAILLAHRLSLGWAVNRSMLAHSGSNIPELPEVLQAPEHASTRDLRIVDALEDPDDAEDPEAEEKPDWLANMRTREDAISSSLRRLRGYWLTQFGFCLAYLVVPAALANLADEPFGDSMAEVAFMVLIWLVITPLSYASIRWEHRPENNGYQWGRVPQIALLGWLLRVALNPRFMAILLAILAAFPLSVLRESGPPWYFAGTVLVFALHLGDFARRSFRNRQGAGVRLLVLRVFSDPAAARFTFERMARYWQRFGVHFTIDDPTYAKYRFRYFRFATLVQFIILFNVYDEYPYWELAVLGVIMAWDWAKLARHWPVKNLEQARARIDRVLEHPRRADGSFRNVSMICHMDLWRRIVEEYARHSDVVLLDLRDYDKERAGVNYEVDFLFDTFPIERIVVLADHESDRDAIYAMLRDRWKELREGSPNADNPAPAVRVFLARNESGYEVKNLIELLLGAGSSPVDESPPEESLVAEPASA